MKNILNILVLLGILSLSLWASCTRNTNETVTCSDSKLVWQDNSEAKTVTKSWSEAIRYCEDLNFAGFSDWRLPNINELRSIVDESIYNPAIYSSFENVNTSNGYWSSTTYASRTSFAWLVGFYGGDGGWYGKSGSTYVRCVRDGQ